MDSKEDEFLTDILDDIFNGKAVLTPKQEERLYARHWGKFRKSL